MHGSAKLTKLALKDESESTYWVNSVPPPPFLKMEYPDSNQSSSDCGTFNYKNGRAETNQRNIDFTWLGKIYYRRFDWYRLTIFSLDIVYRSTVNFTHCHNAEQELLVGELHVPNSYIKENFYTKIIGKRPLTWP